MLRRVLVLAIIIEIVSCIFSIVVSLASPKECYLNARLDSNDGPSVCILSDPLPTSADKLAEHISDLCMKHLLADCDAVFYIARDIYIKKHKERGLAVDVLAVNSVPLHKPRDDNLATIEAMKPDWQDLAESTFLKLTRAKGESNTDAVDASIIKVRKTMEWAMGRSILYEPRVGRRVYMVSICWRALYEVLAHTCQTVYDKRLIWDQPIREASTWTNFRINDAVGSILGLVHAKYPIDVASKGILGPFDAMEAERALHGLKTDGYYILSHTYTTPGVHLTLSFFLQEGGSDDATCKASV